MNQTIEILTEKIKNEIIRQPKRSLQFDEPLISSGLIDLFNLGDLALMVEEIFGVHIDDYELNSDTFDTIEDLAMLIIERQESGV